VCSYQTKTPFFFSSRRRHTISDRDWSSDVCSSDLRHKTMDLAGNGRLDWFFEEWVYGTKVPRYHFEYQLMPADGGQVKLHMTIRSEERRVGKGCRDQCLP